MSRPIVFAVVFAIFIELAGGGQLKDSQPSAPPAAKFVDIATKLGVRFQHEAPHTSKKYLLETMGSGVARFVHDNDGRLDLFLVDGAEINAPSPSAAIPAKTAPKYWNRLYH